jgi:5-methylcytosine-specific restriction endonuclease McrA
METGVFWDLGRVSDDRLRAELTTLLASGYRTEARIVAHIAEVEERKLHAKDGYSSLFDYCVRQLGLSESEAFHRLTAARVARRFPIVFSLIERRQIHLTAVCLLRDYLSPENHQELLAAASNKTKLQIQELLAWRFPRPDVASYVRKLPSRAACAASEHALRPTPPSPQTPRPTPTRTLVEPTSEARYRIQLNASSSLKEKLEFFRALVSHSIPNGDVAAALERALDLALEQVQKQRFAKTAKPRLAIKSRRIAVRRTGTPREHIPNATQREVVARDEMRCTYVSDSGCRCSSRAFLQIHHEEPWARGGSSVPENLRLLCSVHNRLLAERDFGAAHVAERVAARRETDVGANEVEVIAPDVRRELSGGATAPPSLA